MGDDSGTALSDYEQYESKSYSVEDIMSRMDDQLSNVMLVIECPRNVSRVLLDHFNWNMDRFWESFFDTDPSQLFERARIYSPNHSKQPQASQCNEEWLCMICQREMDDDDTITSCSTINNCGHYFHLECFTDYLTHEAQQGKETIRCAWYRCNALVDDELFFKLVRDERAKTLYEQMMLNNYVASSRYLRWCPRPECGRVLEAEMGDVFMPVQCECGIVICLRCSQDWHDPVPCDLLKEWERKKMDDSETTNWLLINTKPCPKCGVNIEKNGGCNHMTCRNPACLAEFCWSCGSLDFRNHYQCHRPNAPLAPNQQQAQDNLVRYKFYQNKHMGHLDSLKFEKKLRETIQTMRHNFEIFSANGFSYVNTSYLSQAANILCQSRRTLSNTYILEYYLCDNNHTKLFMDNQAVLERAVEQLSRMIEDTDQSQLVHKMVADGFRTRVIEIVHNIAQRRQQLVDHIREGYAKNWWTYFHTPL